MASRLTLTTVAASLIGVAIGLGAYTFAYARGCSIDTRDRSPNAALDFRIPGSAVHSTL